MGKHSNPVRMFTLDSIKLSNSDGTLTIIPEGSKCYFVSDRGDRTVVKFKTSIGEIARLIANNRLVLDMNHL